MQQIQALQTSGIWEGIRIVRSLQCDLGHHNRCDAPGLAIWWKSQVHYSFWHSFWIMAQTLYIWSTVFAAASETCIIWSRCWSFSLVHVAGSLFCIQGISSPSFNEKFETLHVGIYCVGSGKVQMERKVIEHCASTMLLPRGVPCNKVPGLNLVWNSKPLVILYGHLFTWAHESNVIMCSYELLHWGDGFTPHLPHFQ